MTRIFLLFSLVPVAAAAGANQTMQGRLIVQEGKPAVLESAGKAVPLTGARRSISATLLDSRISGKDLKVLGTAKPDGTFEVDEFYVVHPDGSLYRLIYFCSTCNITRFAPGHCDCCQQPTVPTEIPLTDPRVARDSSK